MTDEIAYYSGIYGFLQLSMQDVGLLDKKGAPIKKKDRLPHEQDAFAIYNWVSYKLSNLSVGQLMGKAMVMDAAIKKLLNENKTVNNFLLGLLLLRAIVDDGEKSNQILLSGKINRIIDVVDGAVSDGEFNPEIKKTTARVADNLYRQFTGKAQLSDEIRDLRMKRFKKVI